MRAPTLILLALLSLASPVAAGPDEPEQPVMRLPGAFARTDQGCRIWLPLPPEEDAPGPAATWSGACPDGQAEGMGQAVQRRGQRFRLEGTFRAGRPEGRVRMVFRSSWLGLRVDVEGAFGEEGAEGPVEMSYAGGLMVVEYRAGRAVTLLKAKQITGESFEGRMPLKPDGAGYGTMRRSDHTYVGALRGGIPHGEGWLRDDDGGWYFGDWRNGRRQGHGVQTYANGSRISGGWQQNRQHGQSRGIDPNGVVLFDQEWVAGVREGTGWALLPDGDGRYEGGWRGGLPDGAGVLIREDGSRAEGTWRQGCLVGAKPPVAAFTDVVHCGN